MDLAEIDEKGKGLLFSGFTKVSPNFFISTFFPPHHNDPTTISLFITFFSFSSIFSTIVISYLDNQLYHNIRNSSIFHHSLFLSVCHIFHHSVSL